MGKNGPIKLVSVFQRTYLEVVGSNPVTGKKNRPKNSIAGMKGLSPCSC